MSHDSSRDSTRQLISEAEALGHKMGTDERANERKRPPSTRQIVRSAEHLLGRAPAPSGAKLIIKVGSTLAVLAMLVAAYFLLHG